MTARSAIEPEIIMLQSYAINRCTNADSLE
jgi:hypothetical protein